MPEWGTQLLTASTIWIWAPVQKSALLHRLQVYTSESAASNLVSSWLVMTLHQSVNESFTFFPGQPKNVTSLTDPFHSPRSWLFDWSTLNFCILNYSNSRMQNGYLTTSYASNWDWIILFSLKISRCTWAQTHPFFSGHLQGRRKVWSHCREYNAECCSDLPEIPLTDQQDQLAAILWSLHLSVEDGNMF